MMEDKITVKDILKDNYNDFKNKYWCKVPKDMRKHIDEAVIKALKSSDIKYGFAEYKCETSGESTKVPFTCKSKFCNRCGRLYTILSSIKVLAKLSRTCGDIVMGRPCSSHVYQVRPTPKRKETSSHLRPVTLLHVPSGKPTIYLSNVCTPKNCC